MIIRLSYTCKSQRFQSLTLLYISTVFRSYLSFPNFNSTISPNFFHICTFICLVWRYVVYLLHTDHICNYLHTYSTNDNQKCLSRATQILQQWLELYSGAYPENTNSRWWGQYILFCLFVICHWKTFFWLLVIFWNDRMKLLTREKIPQKPIRKHMFANCVFGWKLWHWNIFKGR